MTSLLATQLAQTASLNAALLKGANRGANRRDSYLFSSQEASRHDPESIHGLAYNAFLQLQTLDPKLAEYEDSLFSDAVKTQDRTLLNRAEDNKLNVSLNSFLRRLSAHLFLESTGRVLEWLVRHFRIQQFNVDEVIACFLPYHESPLFARMVQILHLEESKMWSFLQPVKKTGQALPKEMLLAAMARDTDLCRFVTSLLPRALQDSSTHRTLTGFYVATMLGYIKQYSTVDVNLLSMLLPAFSQLLRSKFVDTSLGAYMLLVSLCKKSRLTPQALSTVLTAMAKSVRKSGSPAHLISALVAICGSQYELGEVPNSFLKALAGIPEVGTWLAESCSIVESERLIRPVMTSLALQLPDEKYASIVASILSSPSLPDVITQHGCLIVMRHLADAEGNQIIEPAIKDIVAQLQQRRPSMLAQAAETVISTSGDLGARNIQSALASLTVATDMGAPEAAIVVNTYSADENVRAAGVRQLLDVLPDVQVTNAGTSSAFREALLQRVSDPEYTVLQVLYGSSERLLDILSADELYVALKAAVSGDLKEKPLLLHLNFLAGPFVRRNTTYSSKVFTEIFMQYLLFTKPLFKTANAAWDVLRSSHIGRLPILQGCLEMVPPDEESIDAEGPKQTIYSTINLSIAGRLAGNIVASDDYRDHVEVFLRSLSDDNRGARLFAFVVIHALLSRSLSGQHQVELADRVLGYLETLHAHRALDEWGGSEVSSNEMFLEVYLHPKAASTIQLAEIMLLLEISKIPRPVSMKLDFLCDTSSVIESDMRGNRFVSLLRRTYAFVNRTNKFPSSSAVILKDMFATLKQDVLLFLAGTWASVDELAHIRTAALRHGNAYLRARLDVESIDFQVVVPALLVALLEADQGVRSASLASFQTLLDGCTSGRAPKAVYGYDIAYGSHSDDVQYLEWADFGQFLQLIVSHADEIQLDHAQAQSVLLGGLRKEKGEGKRISAYKDRAVCFMLSHVVAWRSPSARITLLHLLRNVRSGVKLQMLLPLLRKAVEKVGQDDHMAFALLYKDKHDVITPLLHSYDETSIPILNSAEGHAWSTFKKCLNISNDTAVGRMIFSTVVTILRKGLLQALGRDRQLELFEDLIELSLSPNHDYSVIKRTLDETLNESWAMTELIKALRPRDDPSQRMPKRARVDERDATQKTELQLRRLTTLAECLAAKALKGDTDLITALLETLSSLRNAASMSELDVDYVEQLVLTAIASAASHVEDGLRVSSNALRIDLIVDLIRISDNTQTKRQALLTIASLARFSRESVLHNIMPIFTFIGSTALQIDDAYSFSVIQKTIDSIVPVMAASLKDSQGSSLELYTRSRAFLRVFTDASSHIPRHRRSKFFTHLVNVLGAKEFLAPICMLLVDQMAIGVVKQKGVDLPSSFALPLACLQKQDNQERITVLIEMLEEAHRLRKKQEDPRLSSPHTFLDPPIMSDDDERPLSPQLLIRKQIQALILFTGTALELLKPTALVDSTELDARMQQVVTRLLELSASPASGAIDEIYAVASVSLDKALNVVSVANYAAALSHMLDTDDLHLQVAALNITSRLNTVTAKARRSIGSTMAVVIERIFKLLQQTSEATVRLNALQALQTVAQTAMSAEEPALAQGVGHLIQFAQTTGQAERLPVALVLKILIRKLGPRLIPVLKPMVEYSAAIVEETATPGYDNVVASEAFEVLTALISALPNFVGPHLLRILQACLNARLVLTDRLQLSRQSVLRVAAKRIPTKSLLPTVYRLWETQTTDGSSGPAVQFMSPFFDLVQRSIRNTSRPDMVTHLRPMFKFFLDAFDVRRRYFADSAEEVLGVEAACIAAFMQVVVKLSETTFKPLFRRLYDWAIVEPASQALSGSVHAREIVLYRIMDVLLDQLKGIITPYMSILLDHTTDLLRTYAAGVQQDGELWYTVIEVLRKSFEYDEGAFWRDNTLNKSMRAIVDQIEVCSGLKMPSYAGTDASDTLASCIAVMATASSDDVAKALNLAVWMKARSDSVKVKLTMLKVARAVWEKDGERLSSAGYAAETVSFLVECLEDQSEAVENEARVFQRQLARIAGPLEGLI